MVTALARIEGRPLGVDRQQPDAPRRRHRQRRRRQGRALHAALRRVRPAAALPLRHAGHHGRPRGREDGAGAPRGAACSWSARASPCRSSRSCCARATASARRRWRAAASRRRSSRWRGRPASSAAWASRARSSSATATSSRAIEDPAERARALRGDGRRACTSTARRVNIASHFEIDDVIDPADSRRWITARACARRRPAAAAHRQEAALHRHLVAGLARAGARLRSPSARCASADSLESAS